MIAPPLHTRPLIPERIAVAVLCVAAVLGPVALGGTTAWARLGLEAAITLAAILWALSGQRDARTLALPLVIAGCGLLQILPLPDWLLGAIAPVSMGAWKVAHLGMPNAWGRISVDPAATTVGICRLLLGLSAVAVVADLARYQSLRRWLIGALAAAAALIWLLGLVFPFKRDLVLLGFINLRGPIEAEWWKTPLAHPIATNGSGNLEWVAAGAQRYQAATWIAADGFGPYICSNHFAGALCLTLPVALGAWLFLMRGRLPTVVRNGVVVAVGAAALWTVGVMAQSRAGVVALLFGGLVFATLVLERPWPRRITFAAMACCAAFLLAFTVALYGPFTGVEKLLPTPLQPRMASMLNEGRAVAARLAFRMFAASPLFGTGLDTYGELFPRFLRSDFLLHYAHNDYAQLLAETGLAGAAVAAALAWMLVIRCRDFWRFSTPPSRILDAGPWAGIAGIAAHSAFDWNLHVPANALLASIVAGLAMATAVPSQTAGRRPEKRSSKPTILPAALLGLSCLVSLCLLARDAYSETTQRQLREAIVAARIAADPKFTPKNGPQAPPAESKLAASRIAGQRTAAWNPSNAQLALLMGQINLHLATLPQPIDDADARLAAAEEWFRKARRNSAACIGLPEPVPVAP